MVFWRFTFRELASRPGRAILTLLSIVISVAAAVAVNLSTATTHRAYQQMYESLTGRAALEVVAEGGGVYGDEIVAELEQVPGVAAVVPLMQQISALYLGDNRVRLLVMGIDPERDESVRDYELVDGTFFQEDYGALMEIGFARSLGIGVGDEVRLLTRFGPRRVEVLGLLAPRGAAGFNQGGILFLTLRAAQVLYGHRRSINVASLVLEEGAEEQAVKAEVMRRLPEGLAVRTPIARTQLARQTLMDAEQGLHLIYVLTLVLACFMILNTFLMNVQERRPHLAVLRALGTTRRQITRMLVAEGLLMGTAGTLLGSLVGVGGAHLLTTALARVHSAEMPPIQLTPGAFALAALLGCGVSLVSAYLPARLAGRISPLEGMRPAIVEDSAPVPRQWLIAGLAMFGATGLVLAGCVWGSLPLGLTIWAGVFFIVAFILLLPVVLAPMSRAVSAVLAPILGAEGRLAQRQLVRRRARAALTVGLLYIAVCSGVAVGTTILANVQDIRDWQRRTFAGDFFVRVTFLDLASGQAAEMPDSLGRELAAIEGVTEVGSVRFVSANVADQPVVVVLRDFASQQELPLDLKGADSEEIRRRLAGGEVVVGSVLAKQAEVQVGGFLSLQTRDGEKQLRVAATTTEYLVGGLVVHMDRSLGQRLFAVEGADVFMVKAGAATLAGVEARLKAICDERGLMLHSFADLRRRLDGLMNGVVGSLWGLLGLGYVVAGFAIANTLTMNVLDQTRDLALLRVVAMTRRQTRKTILAQAMLIGVIGLAAGIAGGLAGAYVINLAMALALGRALEFAFQPGLLLATFGAGLALVLGAAWVPAVRASRLDLLIALHYE